MKTLCIIFVSGLIISGFLLKSSANKLNKTETKSSQILFFDNFEEITGDGAIFTKWTTENLEGWHFWHTIPWNGNPGQCMRFENTDLNQNDWLITKPINCSGAENLKVNFSHLYHTSKAPPKLYYTSQYNGIASQSTWKELAYSFGENENQWYQSNDLMIENPGDVIYFAFHYQAAANSGTYFLLDNFSVKEYIAPPIYDLVGSSEHFEFYTNLSGESDYWLEIKDALEKSYTKYWEAWMAPGWGEYLDEGVKIKIYYTTRENVSLITPEMPDIKSGFFERVSNSIYLTPLNRVEKVNYYINLEGLAINTFAGFAKRKQLFRDNSQYDNFPGYFYEAFGLFEQGFRIRHDSILSNKDKHPEKYTVQELNSMDIFKNTSDRDIMISYIESQLIGGGYWNEPPNEGYEKIWNNYFTYFHDTTDVVRIKKYGESAYFDIYCSSRDTMYMDSLKVWLERTRQFWVDSFQVQINNRFGLIILYDEKTGMDMTGYDSFNGGAGGLNISPHNFYDGIDGYPWLLAHEFSHTFSIRFGGWVPNGFYQEGLANFVGYIKYSADWSHARPQIEASLFHFNERFGREPILQEFIDNPYQGTDCDLNPYYYGLEFIRYIYESNGTLKIKEFFSNRMDFSVFNKLYSQIENEYLIRLKKYRYLFPTVDTPITLPFIESFESFENGWIKPSYKNQDNWQIDDKGTKGTKGTNCARFYTYSDKNTPIKSWLITPPLNGKNLGKVVFSFDYHGNGSELEVFYTNKFGGDTDKSNWNSIQKISMTESWDWRNSGEITLLAPPDTLFLGIRYSSPGEQHQQVYIDNFIIKDRATELSEIALNDLEFKIYPNPVTRESIISFTTKTNDSVNLTVYDIQGQKICTLLDEKLNAGKHTIQLVNQIQSSGVYLCKLATSKGISTLKLVVK